MNWFRSWFGGDKKEPQDENRPDPAPAQTGNADTAGSPVSLIDHVTDSEHDELYARVKDLVEDSEGTAANLEPETVPVVSELSDSLAVKPTGEAQPIVLDVVGSTDGEAVPRDVGLPPESERETFARLHFERAQAEFDDLWRHGRFNTSTYWSKIKASITLHSDGRMDVPIDAETPSELTVSDIREFAASERDELKKRGRFVAEVGGTYDGLHSMKIFSDGHLHVPLTENPEDIRSLEDQEILIVDKFGKPAGTFNPHVMESQIGEDDRSVVNEVVEAGDGTYLPARPWRGICSLYCQFPNKSVGGTGWFIGKRTIMTAAHNLYDRATGQAVTRLIVTPGRYGRTLMPFGQQVATRFSFDNRYRDDSANFAMQFDYGFIILDDSTLGDQLQFDWDYVVRPVADLPQGYVNAAGYPAGERWGELLRGAGQVKKVHHNVIVHDIDTNGGQSGCPIYWTDGQGRYFAIGVHTQGIGTFGFNAGVRITPEMKSLMDWAASNPGSLPQGAFRAPSDPAPTG